MWNSLENVLSPHLKSLSLCCFSRHSFRRFMIQKCRSTRGIQKKNFFFITKWNKMKLTITWESSCGSAGSMLRPDSGLKTNNALQVSEVKHKNMDWWGGCLQLWQVNRVQVRKTGWQEKRKLRTSEEPYTSQGSKLTQEPLNINKHNHRP